MWQQNYTPMAGSLAWSGLIAALPVFVMLYLLGAKRKPAWIASLSGLATAAAIAVAAYQMPVGPMLSAIGYGAAFGLFPIGWVVFTAILLYRITLETGNFEIIKDSVGALTGDRRLQALLIAFAFGAFIEGAAGFGTPVAVAAAMLSGLGFAPFYAAGICLLANTAPVAFGSIGTPILTLSAVTGLPLNGLSAWVGRICAPISLIVPAYLIVVMGGWRALKGVLVAAAVCGGTFASVQFVVSNFVGPQPTDILSSMAAMGALVVLFLFWRPGDAFQFRGGDDHSQAGQPGRTVEAAGRPMSVAGTAGAAALGTHHSAGQVLLAWAPYAILVVFVLAWGFLKNSLNAVSIVFPWPGLHAHVLQAPPVVAKVTPYAAMYRFDWLSASGTACLCGALVSALVLRMPLRQFVGVVKTTARQLFLSLVTIAAVLALAFLMNYCGATATLGLGFAATGALFPFFSALLGWLGVFLTGSDTSANALFGNLQVVTAGRLGLDPVLMAAANSSGGVMGKMISLQSIAVAAAATHMPQEDEARLFRFTLRHSILLAAAIGLITLLYSKVF